MSEEITKQRESILQLRMAKVRGLKSLLLFLKTTATLFLFLFFSCTQTIVFLSSEDYSKNKMRKKKKHVKVSIFGF